MNTRDPIENPRARLVAVVTMALAVIAAPARAEEDAAQAIVVRPIDRHPATDAAARRLLVRLDRAAIEVCGGSAFSLRDVKDALRAAPCWNDAMAGAVAQIDSPRLDDVFRRSRAEGRGDAR